MAGHHSRSGTCSRFFSCFVQIFYVYVFPCVGESSSSLPGNNMIRKKCVTTRQPGAQWRRCGDDNILRRDCLCESLTRLTLLCSHCWLCRCFVVVFAVAILVVFIAVWRHRRRCCCHCRRRRHRCRRRCRPRSPCPHGPCRARRRLHC